MSPENESVFGGRCSPLASVLSVIIIDNSVTNVI